MIKVIRYLMKENKITAHKLTQDLQISNSSITDWEKGKGTPSINTLIKIADYFDVSVEYLLGRTIERKQNEPKLNEGEQKLLEDYRSMSDEGRKYINVTMSMAADRFKKS